MGWLKNLFGGGNKRGSRPSPRMSDGRSRKKPAASKAVAPKRASAFIEQPTVDDYHQLTSLVPSKDLEIVQLLKKHASFKILVTDQHDIYCVKPDPGGSHAMAFRAISALVKAKAKGSVKLCYVSKTVFTSYLEARNKDNLDAGNAARTNDRVNELFSSAIAAGASDIHIRIREEDTHVLFRINQLLRPHEKIDSDTATRLVTAMFNTYGGGKDYSKDKSLDTSFSLHAAKSDFMIRTNSTKEKRGASVVSRIRNTKELLPLERAGYTTAQLQHLRAITDKHQGMLIITGPTNSGKSTTLTTIMNNLPRQAAVNEVADPIEVVLPFVQHFEVKNDDPGEMERVMKDMVRQDPDYLIVGEIRSQETAKAATMLAYAGTSVMTTMHTNSVSAAFPRAIHLGMEKMDLAVDGFLNGVVSQNLIPVLCKHCALTSVNRKSASEDDNKKATDSFKEVFLGHERNLRFWNEEGCSHCKGQGVSSITLIAEVLEMNSDTRRIVDSGKFFELQEYMDSQGIFTKHSHAATKVMRGMFDPAMVQDRIDPFTRGHVEAALKVRRNNAIQNGAATPRNIKNTESRPHV